MSLINPLNHSFGLDIGDRTFKIIQVSKYGNKEKPHQIDAWGSIDIPEGVMEQGEIIDSKKASGYLIKLLGNMNGRLRGNSTVAGLPEARSFVKVIEMKHTTDPSVIQKAVSKEIEENIPLPTNEIYYDWHPIEKGQNASSVKLSPNKLITDTEKTDEKDTDEKSNDKEKNGTEDDKKEDDEKESDEKTDKEPPVEEVTPPDKTMQVILAAAPRKLVDDYVQMIEAAGLAPIALEIEASAIARAMIPLEESLTEPVGILDIGATRSSLIVCDNGAMQMSISIPLSGNELTRIISEKLNIDLKDAELVKKECGLDAHRCEDKMWNILLPIIDDMSTKIRNSLRFYRIGFPSGKKIEKLSLCGGGAHFRDIDTVLSRKLTIKVHSGDSLINIGKVPNDFPKSSFLSYTTAIGLALRASEENQRFRHSFRL